MNVQNFDHISDKRLITGTSGTGKTTLLLKLVKKERARLRFFFDGEGEFAQKLKIPSVYDCERLTERTALGGYVIFDPIGMFSGRKPEGFAFFCDYVFNVCGELRGRKILSSDELQKVQENNKVPFELVNIMDSGRRLELDVFFICQAPNALHNRVRNQITQVYSFRQNEKAAIAYLVENGFPEEQLRSLPDHKYLWKNLRTGESNFGNATPKTEPTGKANPPAAEQGV